MYKTKQVEVASLRSNLVKTLVCCWVRENRPDVYEACTEEAAKKFPYTGPRRHYQRLPEHLASIPAFKLKGGKG